jgi:FG-GAP-like repeat/FlgD Ig-like domain
MRCRFNLVLLCLVPMLAGAQPTFLQHEITTSVNNPLGMVAAQFDVDDQLEIAVGDYRDGLVYIINGSGDTWEAQQISSTADGIIDFATGDVDGDGDVDLIGAVYSDDKIVWWENQQGTWIQHFLSEFDQARRVDVADLDGDGDLDVAAVSGSVLGLTWWENNGNGVSWVTHNISAVDELWGLAMGDMDNDGDIDIPMTECADGRILWYENTGNEWTSTLIASGLNYPKDISVADINGDGLLDVVVAENNGNSVRWYQNQPEPNWPEHWVAVLNDANDVDTGDIDLDGDMDIAAAGYADNSVQWWEQNDGQWLHHTLVPSFLLPWNLDLADIDADGDLDIVSGQYEDENVIWWEQEGTPGPVRLDLIPQITTVPAQGGLIYYDATLVSELPNSYPGLSYWTAAELPNGQLFGPLSRINFTLRPFQDTHVVALSQNIPEDAPPGQYVFSGYVGYFPVPQLDDRFNFFKEGVGVSNGVVFNPDDWVADNESWLTEIEGESGKDATVTDYQLSEAWPNPFNSATSFTVTLEAEAQLTVTVHNVTGQTVATIAQSRHSAGQHQFSFDGSNVAAGLYFVSAHVPGVFEQTRKILLIK